MQEIKISNSARKKHKSRSTERSRRAEGASDGDWKDGAGTKPPSYYK
jgi:hypothetical protein